MGAYTPIRLPFRVSPDFIPSTPAQLADCLADPLWRICSGRLYKVMTKGKASDGSDADVVPFRPNRAQMRLLSRLHTRNIVLKARQLGMTTLVALMWLDHALFNGDQRCGIVAQDVEAAEGIFRDKVKFAYLNLPPEIRAVRPLLRESASELLFTNNSSIRVATSMRSGTIHRLHVSEFGKIGAKYPDKAREVVTGSLPAVPSDGVIVIESTAEGQSGEFYNMATRALALEEKGATLNVRDYRLHFFPWFEEPTYRTQGEVVTTDADREYFGKVTSETLAQLDEGQRRWYIATRESDFSGEAAKMWQEYPSTPREAFQVSTEGTYYAQQLTKARTEKRITRVPYVEGVPVNTFWDIGSSDGTAIWLHQRIQFQDRFIGFIENWGEPYAYYIAELQKLRYVWGSHYLPHDADHERQQGDRIAAPIDELREFGIGGSWIIVPAVDDVNHGIQAMRTAFTACYFDEEKCAAGLKHLGSYRKVWNARAGGWSSRPRKDDGHSEAADALRQFAQGFRPREKAPPGGHDRAERRVNRRLAGGLIT